MTLSACGTLHRDLEKAATVQGQVQAQPVKPITPDDCRKKEPHAPLAVGTELHEALIRERLQLNKQNARTDRCNKFWDDYWTGVTSASN